MFTRLLRTLFWLLLWLMAVLLGPGGLLLFAFFMISDPMTIPNRHGARVGYAIVAILTFFVVGTLLYALLAQTFLPTLPMPAPLA